MSDGNYAIIRPSLDRRLAMDGFAALPESHPMVALLELDVTAALAAIEAQRRRGTRVSLFSFVVQSIARAIAEHPDLNLVRHGKRLIRFEDVDISVPVEVRTADGHYPREVVLRKAQLRTAADLFAELENARERHDRTGALGAEDRGNRRLMHAFAWLPRFVRLFVMRRMMRSGFRIKRMAGTTLVTSVGKFAAIPGHAFTLITGPRAATFAIGSVVEKPWLHRGQIVPRSILALSIMIDHDLVDGGPAARFARRLQQLVESADGLTEDIDVIPPPPPTERVSTAPATV